MTAPDLNPERVDQLAEVVLEHAYTYPDTFCACGKGMTEPWREWAEHVAQALAPLVARWVAEAEVVGQMKHITAEMVRGDVPLSESEELIAALRARISHVEAERDEAFRVAPNMGSAVYERGKRDGATEVRARVEAVLAPVPYGVIPPRMLRDIRAAMTTTEEQR